VDLARFLDARVKPAQEGDINPRSGRFTTQ
jgi:hypothetical protein